MGLHYLEKQRAVFRIGSELRRRGWELFGYDPGEIDSMTDYFRPASWDGIATHPDRPGVVVGVQVNEYIANRSGKNDWPEFHSTPKRRGWHIERDGKIVTTGVASLGKCSQYDDDSWQPQVKTVVDAIESYIAASPSATQKTSTKVDQITVQHDRDWTWVHFPNKPSESIRDQLRKMGGKFSSRREAWYFRRPVADEDLAWLFEETVTPDVSQEYDIETKKEQVMKPTAYYYYQKVDGITWLHFPYASKEDEAEILRLGFSKLLLSGIELLDEVAKKNITANSNEYVPIEQIRLAFPQWEIVAAGTAGYVPGQMSTYTYAPPWMDFPELYSGQHKPNPLAVIKLFTPDSSWTWYITEINRDEELCFGLVAGLETELGYFSLAEMREVKGRMNLHIERDKWFRPTPIRDLAEYKAEWGDGGPYKGEAALAPAPKKPKTPQLPPLGWKEEDIRFLLGKLDADIPILVADDKLGIPTIHDDFGAATNHIGFGVMEVKGLQYTLVFDAGRSLSHTPSGNGWTAIQIRGDYPYDFKQVRQTLLTWLGENTETEPEQVVTLTTEKALEANIELIDAPEDLPDSHPTITAKELERITAPQPEKLTRSAALAILDETMQPRNNPVQEALHQETIVLTYGNNGNQVYFENADYVLLNPYMDANGMRYAGGWSMHKKNTDGSIIPVLDPVIGENGIVGGYSLADTVKAAENALGMHIELIDAPEDLPDSYPTITAEELERLTAPQPEKLTRSAALAILDEAASPQNNPAQTLTLGMLDAVERVEKAEIVPVFSKQLTGQAAVDLLLAAAAIVPEMTGVGGGDNHHTGIPRGSLTVLYADSNIWSGDTRTFIENGEKSLLAAFAYLHDVASYVRIMWGYTVLAVSKDYVGGTNVKIADDLPEPKYVEVTHELWGDVALSIQSAKPVDVLAEAVKDCYANPDLPLDWNIEEGVHLAAHIRSVLRAAYDLEKMGQKKVFFDELMEGFRQLVKSGHGLLSPVWNVQLWNPARFIETAGLVDVIERKHWRYVPADQRRLAKNIKGDVSALVAALDKEPTEKRRNALLSEIADTGDLPDVPDVYISAKKAGKPDDVIPDPEILTASEEPEAAATAPIAVDVEAPTAPPDTPWSAAPEDEAEFDLYSLELLTGMVRKQGAFHRALAQITRPGTLRVALTRANGDQRRHELIEMRLKKLEKAAPVAAAA